MQNIFSIALIFYGADYVEVQTKTENNHPQEAYNAHLSLSPEMMEHLQAKEHEKFDNLFASVAVISVCEYPLF